MTRRDTAQCTLLLVAMGLVLLVCDYLGSTLWTP